MTAFLTSPRVQVNFAQLLRLVQLFRGSLLPNRLITLTTDFGLNDHFVGAMRGVILSINPQAQIVDICNAVHSFDVLDGALTIAQAAPYFPADTVHVVIVDPGVGSQRRPI